MARRSLVSLAFISTLAVACVTSVFANGAQEQSSATSAAKFPDKAITLMVPYGAGGGTDVTARMLADPLSKVLGVPVVVLNIAGGGGWNGWSKLAHAKPDGYFIGYTNIPNMYAGYLDPKMHRSESLKSFTPIVANVVDPCIWSVLPNSKFKTLKQLLNYAKAHPGEVSIDAHGFGGDDWLGIHRIEKLTGAKFSIVENNSTAQSITQALGGDIDVLAANVSEVASRIHSGQFRGLGVLMDKRSKFLPNVPTFKEQGYDDVMFAGRVISGPAGMSKARVDLLLAAIEKAVQDPQYKAKMQKLGLGLDMRTGKALQTFLVDNQQMVKSLMGW